MPKISKGGVSNIRVDADYMAPSGIAPEVGLDIGAPDAGKAPEPEPVKAASKKAASSGKRQA